MYKRVPASSIRFFRLLFGVLLAFDIWDERSLKSGLSGDFLFIRCRLPHVDCPLAYPTPEIARIFYWIALVAALGIAFDILYPIASTVHFLIRLWIFNMDRTRWNNHSYNWVLMTFLLCVMGRSFSGPIFPPRAQRKEFIEIIRNDPNSTFVESSESREATFGKHLDRYTVPVYIVCLIRAQILQIYMWAAFVKLEQDWLDGSALGTTMSPSTSWYTVIFMSYSGLFIDFSIPVAMCLYFIPMKSPSFIGRWLSRNPFFRQALKFLVFAGVVSFNTINHVTHHLGIFSVSMLGSSILFMNSATPIVFLEEFFDILGPMIVAVQGLKSRLMSIRIVATRWLTALPVLRGLFPGKTKDDAEVTEASQPLVPSSDSSPSPDSSEANSRVKWRSWRDDLATKSFIVVWVLYNSLTASTRVWYAGLPNGALGGFDGPARGTWDMFLRNERWQHGEVQVFDPVSNRTIRRNPGPDVHRRGVKYLFKRPDLTYIYMKCLKRIIVEDRVFEVPETMSAEEFSNQLQVKVQSWLSTNGRPFQRYVNPSFSPEEFFLARDADVGAVEKAVARGFYPMSSLAEPSPLPPCPFCNKVLSYYGGNRRNPLFDAVISDSPVLLDMAYGGRVEKFCKELRTSKHMGELHAHTEKRKHYIVNKPQAVCNELPKWQAFYQRSLYSAKQYSHGVYAMIEQPGGIFYGRSLDQLAFMEGPGKLVVFIYSQMPDFKAKSGFGEKSVPKFPENVDINNPKTLLPYVRVLEKLGDRLSLQKYPGSTELHHFKAWTVGGTATFLVVQENTWLSTFRSKKGFLTREEQDAIHTAMDFFDMYRQESLDMPEKGCPFNEDLYILVIEILQSIFDMISHLVTIANNLAVDSSEADLLYVVERILEIQFFPNHPELSLVYEKLKPCMRTPLLRSLTPILKTLMLVPREEGESLLDDSAHLETEDMITSVFSRKAGAKIKKSNNSKIHVGEKAYFLSPMIIDWPLADDLSP